jgi:hypothetical protein
METFEGHNGQIRFDGVTVTITREGKWGERSKLPTVVIPLSEVVDVQLHEGHGPIAGWVFIATQQDSVMPKALEVAHHPNTVIVSKSEAVDFEPMRQEILAALTR